jgi:hypothetical protein
LSARRFVRAWLAAALAVLALRAPAWAEAPNCPPTPLAPTAQQIQDGQRLHARDRGFLWRISRDGRSSYLYGTIHLGRFEWIFPGPAVVQALRETDTLALELDLGDPDTLRRTQAAMARPQGEPALPPAQAARLQRQAELACVPPAALAPLHPLVQAMTLAILAGRWEGLDPAWGQEQVLAGFARAAARPIVSLETPQAQLAALIPSRPEQAQAMLDQWLAQLEDGSARRQMQVLGAVWERSDLERLAQHDEWCECVRDEDDRATLRRLNDDRNPGLAERIDGLHGEGRRVFAAVGALHMVGPQALPALLQARGFAVERVPFAR